MLTNPILQGSNHKIRFHTVDEAKVRNDFPFTAEENCFIRVIYSTTVNAGVNAHCYLSSMLLNDAAYIAFTGTTRGGTVSQLAYVRKGDTIQIYSSADLTGIHYHKV